MASSENMGRKGEISHAFHDHVHGDAVGVLGQDFDCPVGDAQIGGGFIPLYRNGFKPFL